MTTTNTAPRMLTAGTIEIAGQTWDARAEVNPARYEKYDAEIAAAPWIIETPRNTTVGIAVPEAPEDLRRFLTRIPNALISAQAITPPELEWTSRTTTDGLVVDETDLLVLYPADDSPVHVSAWVSADFNGTLTYSELRDISFMFRDRHGHSDWRLILPCYDTTPTFEDLAVRLTSAVLPFF